jgi:type I restriction enzyme S subunit
LDYCRYPQVPFRRIFQPLFRPVPIDAEIVTAFTNGQVTLRSNRRLGGYHEAANLSGFQGVRRGDFVVHGLDILRGSVGVSDSDGAISAVCTVCAPRRPIDPRFFAYAIRAQAQSGFPRAMARGIREGGADFRRWETLGELPLPLPPQNQIGMIADYLDAMTRRLDAIVSGLRRSVALLTERRVTLISREMSPTRTGTAEWRRTRLKYLAAVPITNGIGEPGAFDNPEWPRYVRTTDIAGPRSLRSDVFASLPPETAARALLERGDIVMTAAGATVGKSLLFDLEQPACYAGYLVRFRARSSVDPSFISYWTESVQYADQIATGKVVSTIDNFSAGKYQNLLLDVPEFEAQREIAVRLDRMTGHIESLIRSRRQQVSLLLERREALITAAVMGRLEIPGVAA